LMKIEAVEFAMRSSARAPTWRAFCRPTNPVQANLSFLAHSTPLVHLTPSTLSRGRRQVGPACHAHPLPPVGRRSHPSHGRDILPLPGVVPSPMPLLLPIEPPSMCRLPRAASTPPHLPQPPPHRLHRALMAPHRLSSLHHLARPLPFLLHPIKGGSRALFHLHLSSPAPSRTAQTRRSAAALRSPPALIYYSATSLAAPRA
jgi:hypothetical protein